MEANTIKNEAFSKPDKAKGDKIEVVKILLLMTFSFLLGFALVIIFLKPSNNAVGDTMPPSQAIAQRPSTETAAPTPKANDRYAPPEPSQTPPAETPPAEVNAPVETAVPPNDLPEPETDTITVPPGRTPPGVQLDGDGFYIKCWDGDGREHPGNACDRIETFEKRLSTRLYVVDECRKNSLGSDASGKLSLGVEVDLAEGTLSYWTGPSSDLPNVGKMATCLRTKLSGLPMRGFDHNFQKYRLFFTILFEGQQKQSPKKQKNSVLAKKGSMVRVIKDHVRVRKEPINGTVIGKINSGNEVQLLSKKSDWCQVLTPNKNRGWMICDALSK